MIPSPVPAGKLRVTFLGTGTSQGVPVIACTCHVCTSPDPKDKRLRSSVLLETSDTTVVIDTGPDFRYQMLRAAVTKLDAVVFTHEHKDHIAGLDDVRAFNFKDEMDMPLYCNDAVETAIRREFGYAFREVKYPGVPQLVFRPIDTGTFSIGDMEITPIQVMHHRMPVLGFRCRNFTYITDANYIAPQELEKIKGSDVFVLNALRMQTHISHYNLHQALEVIRETAPAQGYLTHISHWLGRHQEISPDLPKNVALAYDGLQILV